MTSSAATRRPRSALRRRGLLLSGLLAVAGLVLAGVAVSGLVSSREGLQRVEADASGVPVTIIRPAGVTGRVPGVVVAHGFAASSALSEALGLALARRGYVVALPDLTGHGANPAALPVGDGGPSRQSLQDDLARTVDLLRSQSDVDPAQIVLVGHSMGAGAVVRYAVAEPAGAPPIAATVAISLPSADDVPVGQRQPPRNLLLLYGSAEPARFRDAAQTALRAAFPDAVVGTSYGDFADGSARAAEEVPGVEHISIVLSGTTADRVGDWVARATDDGRPVPGGGSPVLPATLLLVAVLVLLWPVIARVAFGGRTSPAVEPRRVPPWQALAIAAVSFVVATAAARVAGPATGWFPVAVGGFLWPWFLAAGALAWLGARRWRHESADDPSDLARESTARVVVATLAVTAVTVATLALVLPLAFAEIALVGDRRVVLPLMEAALLVFFLADEALVSGRGRAQRLALVAGSRVLAVIVLLGSVVVGAPGFLTLLLPPMVILFALLAYHAHVVAGLTREWWPRATVQAIPLAYLVAATFPLVSGA